MTNLSLLYTLYVCTCGDKWQIWNSCNSDILTSTLLQLKQLRQRYVFQGPGNSMRKNTEFEVYLSDSSCCLKKRTQKFLLACTYHSAFNGFNRFVMDQYLQTMAELLSHNYDVLRGFRVLWPRYLKHKGFMVNHGQSWSIRVVERGREQIG